MSLDLTAVSNLQTIYALPLDSFARSVTPRTDGRLFHDDRSFIATAHTVPCQASRISQAFVRQGPGRRLTIDGIRSSEHFLSWTNSSVKKSSAFH
jgi:hypothetical protein